MDPQVPDPERVVNTEQSQSIKPRVEGHQINNPSQDGHWVSVLAVAIFVILALGTVIFLYYQNQQLKSMLASYQPTPPTVPALAPTPFVEKIDGPVISSPSANTKIASPLKVAGTVPTGWMFEGVFPIKLVDANRKLIVQGQAKEKEPGSWQSGNPVDFIATLTFKSASGSGFIILQNDNPSWDQPKSKTFEFPVKFSETGVKVSPLQ